MRELVPVIFFRECPRMGQHLQARRLHRKMMLCGMGQHVWCRSNQVSAEHDGGAHSRGPGMGGASGLGDDDGGGQRSHGRVGGVVGGVTQLRSGPTRIQDCTSAGEDGVDEPLVGVR